MVPTQQLFENSVGNSKCWIKREKKHNINFAMKNINLCRGQNWSGKHERMHKQNPGTIKRHSKIAGHKVNVQKSITFLYTKMKQVQFGRKYGKYFHWCYQMRHLGIKLWICVRFIWGKV